MSADKAEDRGAVEDEKERRLRRSLKQKIKKKDKPLTWRKRKEQHKPEKEEKLLNQLKEFKSYKEPAESVENNTIEDDGVEEVVEKKKSSKLSTQGRRYTVSIALPGSIMDNAQSAELRTYLAGQIARAAAVFCVDEIIIFDEHAKITRNDIDAFDRGQWPQPGAMDKPGDCNFLLARILQYLECPQYLRKALFPLQRQLQYAGLLNPLDAMHHLRHDDLSIPYREAVVLNKPVKEGRGSFCDAGLAKEVQVDRSLEAGIRVTLKLTSTDMMKRNLRADVVSPSEPRKKGGIYWGYSVRVASSLGGVFKDGPYEYDMLMGTSERGQSVDEVEVPNFKHGLIVFGGLNGLEACLDADQSLSADNPADLFQLYINSLPDQGSHTIRTEEAILITLGALRPKFIG
uniref:Uncharacterized protein n=1 Tax=Plectus sambesii TaxID=2011161 RepID=A0A914WCT5_9BILA